jgi:glycosyltransferase involved in cell wall biosynthesis
MSVPLLPDVGILGLVPERWGGPWMPRHHVMTRLARYFHVVWMDPAREWRKSWRAEQGTAAFPAASGFHHYQPPSWLPRVYRPLFLAEATARARVRQAAATLAARGCRRLVLYVWRPELGDTLDYMPHDLSCYHIDDEYSFSDAELPIDPTEAALLARADQVIIHSPALLEKKGTRDHRTAFVPNGVDYAAYALERPEPDDLRVIPHPRIGYVGLIKQQLDFVLLHALAERHPAWHFVFVGPDWSLGDQAALRASLAQRSNVTFLGGRPVEALPAYTQHLDVCLMCYQVNDYTKFIYPLKLHEYLAAGRPVVGAPIRTLRDFAHVLEIAETPTEWSAAIARSLAPAASTPERIAARRAAARPHDWDRLVATIARLLADKLGPPYAARLAASDSFEPARAVPCPV